MNMGEVVSILKEIGKNVIMGSGLLKSLRNKIASGRTTGGLEVHRAVQHSLSIFQQYQKGLEDAGLPTTYFENKAIMEIGPGANLGVELNFIGAGASRADALDRFSDIQSTAKEVEIYKEILATLTDEQKNRCKAAFFVKAGRPVFDPEKISYFGNCGLEMVSERFNREYDMCVSHLALEHVADLSKGVAATTKILKKGGICIYICNLVSLGGVYNHEKEPLRLLNYSDSLWNKMFSNRGGSNRVRASGYKNLLEQNGFRILSFKSLASMSQEQLRKIKPQFNKQFKKLPDEELAILKFRLVARLDK